MELFKLRNQRVRFKYLKFEYGIMILYIYNTFTVCDNGIYGANCSMPCGQCLESAQCHHVNGTCMNGCASGYRGFKCTDGLLF